MASPRLLRTDAVVLRRHDLGETDRIVTLYTSAYGKLRAVAKGIRRPTSKLGGHLELFTHSRLMLARGRNLDVITQVETVSSFLGLREDLWRTGLAYYVAELIDRLTEERAENPALFDLLIATFERLASARRPDQVVRLFEMQAVGLLGYRPELRDCVLCRKPLEPVGNAFSIPNGGVLCSICRTADPQATPLTTNGLKVLRLYQEGNWNLASRLHLSPELVSELEHVCTGYATSVADSQLKSANFVASLRREGLGRDASPASTNKPV
jgi:DNA repair protein RecO (recombination protein O)